MNYNTPPQCHVCSRFCGYMADNGTRFGCADPSSPEPFDPDYFCKKCANKKLIEAVEMIKKNGEGKFYGCHWWILPDFYREALKEAGYEMNRSSDNTHFILTNIKENK